MWHPTVRELSLAENAVPGGDENAVGSLLAALVCAHPQALASLDVSCCQLCDDGLRPLAAALRGCTALRTLRCEDNHVSGRFARDELAPAVAANASLRKLTAAYGAADDELAVVEALVATRPPVA